jgi:hypothetical protein
MAFGRSDLMTRPRNDFGPVSKFPIFTTILRQALATVSGSTDTVGSAYRSCYDIRGSELLPFRCFRICTSGRSASRRWAAYVCSDCSISVERILETVADRWSIEEQFHDVEGLWGAGEQQVRNIWLSIGCWNICSWLYTLVELECWNDSSDELVDRQDRPWDDPTRRPLLNDRRRKIARKMLRETFFRDL